MTNFASSLVPVAFGTALDVAFLSNLAYTTNFQSLGYGGYTSTTPVGIMNTNSGSSDVAAFDIRGSFAVSGGTVGFVQNTARLLTTVSSGVSTYVWGLLSVLNNSATGGQNVAGYFQGNKITTGAGPTWGATIEVREQVAINNPTGGTIGLEVDNRSNGSDSSGNRVIVDAVATRYGLTGAATTVTYGYRVQNGSEGANAVVTYGFGLNTGLNVNIGFDAALATVSQSAFRMAQNQAISFDSAMTQQLYYNGTGLRYAVSGTEKVLLNGNGSISLSGNQIIGGRITGYGTPTGGAHQPSFAAGSITLANLAACVAQLIVDLETHGMIGA